MKPYKSRENKSQFLSKYRQRWFLTQSCLFDNVMYRARRSKGLRNTNNEEFSAFYQALPSVRCETSIFHSASFENVKFEACEVFETKELAFSNDCFKHERNKEIGVLYQALLILFFSVTFLSSCTHDNEEDLYGDFCKKENLSFSEDISPILADRCLFCHSSENSSSLGAGIQLEGYENVKAFIDNGSFLGSIKHLSNYSAMPKGGAKLEECKIEQIEVWIEEGALNN